MQQRAAQLFAAATSPSLNQTPYSNSYWQTVASASDMTAGYPLSVVVHSGFRPQSSPDVSLHNISLSSFLHAFVGQWDQSDRELSGALMNNSMLVTWSLDVQSFELHPRMLALQIRNLQRLSLGFRKVQPYLEFRFLFSVGIASSYRKALRQCDSLAWCRYSWGQKSVSKHMHLCTLQYKLASPAGITS